MSARFAQSIENCVGVAASTPRTPQVLAAAQELDTTVSLLIENVAQLAQRLAPVVQPTPASGGSGGKTTGGQVALAEVIITQSERVRALNEQVTSLLSGLEL